MPISSAGVSNYANVTSGTALGVSAEDAGDVSGAGVTVLYGGLTTVTINGLVVAGGGSSPAISTRGGGGAGGFRTYQAVYQATGTIETGTVTVGASGSDSVLKTITSARGGNGAPSSTAGSPGGSGGGSGASAPTPFIGSGNSPPTSPPQGNPGGSGGGGVSNGGGGGGAGGAGFAQGGSGVTNAGGRGATNSLLGTFTSTTSNTIGTGSITFTVPTGLSNLNAGEGLRAAIDDSNYMDCQITSYNSGTGSLVLNCKQSVFITGSGTSSSWTFTRLYACGGASAGNATNTCFAAANTGAGANSGIVIISVPNAASVAFSGGVTSTLTNVGTNKVYKVTATSTTSETYTVTVP